MSTEGLRVAGWTHNSHFARTHARAYASNATYPLNVQPATQRKNSSMTTNPCDNPWCEKPHPHRRLLPRPATPSASGNA